MTRDAILRNAAGVGLAVAVYGVSFGALALAAGFTPAQACAMSLIVYTGASQFAFIAVLGSGGSAVAAVVNGLLLGARNVAYGVVIAPLLNRRRLLGSWLVGDEAVAMSRAQHDPGRARLAYWATGAAVFVGWNLGTAAGALGGEALGDPKRLGLDGAFPAAFLALLVPQATSAPARRAALAGAAIALLLVPLLPAGLPILAAGLGVLAARGPRA
jgi:predicted branched-subunit amino acid permease